MRCRKEIRKIELGILTGLAVLVTGIPACAEETVDIEELFYTYSNDRQVYDLTDTNFLHGWTWTLEYKNYNGYLALDQLDLDWNGTEELLAIRIKQPDETTDQNDLIAEVYQYEGDKLKRVAQCTLAEDVLTTSEADIEVFLVNTDNGIYLCCEDKGTMNFLSNGVDWNLRTFTYDGASFVQQADTEIVGSSWDESDLEPAREALNAIGLYPAELVNTPVTDQVDNLTRINTIQRYLTESLDTVNAYLEDPEAELMEYGATWFHSYQNEDRENKNTDGFASYGDHDSELTKTEAAENEDYIIPDSDSRYITEEDLADLSDYEILLARNEIYARHGRIFVNEDLNTYFRSKSWYQPSVSGDQFTEEYAASVFNDYEARNIDTIVTYEKEHNINQF